MKKQITIYLIGVVIAGWMSFHWIDSLNKKYNDQMTFGDVALVVSYSCLSWLSVIAYSVVYIADSEFWDTPINNK